MRIVASRSATRFGNITHDRVLVIPDPTGRRLVLEGMRCRYFIHPDDLTDESMICICAGGLDTLRLGFRIDPQTQAILALTEDENDDLSNDETRKHHFPNVIWEIEKALGVTFPFVPSFRMRMTLQGMLLTHDGIPRARIEAYLKAGK